MFRYVAMAWSPRDTQQAQVVHALSERLCTPASRWKDSFHSPGLRVFSIDSHESSLDARPLTEHAGVVLGTIFEGPLQPGADTPARKLQLDLATSAAIVRSRGRWLIDHAWGNYVAFILDRSEAGTRWILKDPTGSLPCYRTQYKHVHIFFSSITDCLDLGLTFSANRSFLRSRILCQGGEDHCALDEVFKIHGGECFELSHAKSVTSVTKQLYWSPSTFAETSDPIEDAARAQRVMRASVRACTHSWASCHDSVLLSLSGGLDSSIVLGCLKDAPARPRLVSYTFYNPRGRSDERPWARMAAQSAACEHVECPVVPEDRPLNIALEMPASVEPLSALIYLHRRTMEESLAASCGASAVFNGDGGDSGFGAGALAFVVPEYLKRHGFGLRVLELASQVALATQQSHLGILAKAVRQQLRADPQKERRSLLLRVSKLIHPDLRKQVGASTYQDHPWFHAVEAVPWATIRRIGGLLSPSEFYNTSTTGNTPHAETIAPLYSQPVIEQLLRIPVYTHFYGGRSRGLARAAFKDDVPQPILQRLWKDRVPGFFEDLIERNRKFLLGFFLDGVLVREGYLDRIAVEAAFSPRTSNSDIVAGEVIRHFDTENWVRSWTAAAGRQAAAA